jgi:hypothetical protein
MKALSHKRRVTIPRHVRSLLWEYKGRAVTWPRDSAIVMRKVLEQGEWESVQWLRKTGGDAALREWIIDNRGRGLDPRRLRFWQLVLRLPRRSVDMWVAASASNPWNRRWRQ